MSDESAVKEVVVEVQSPLNDDDAAADAATEPELAPEPETVPDKTYVVDEDDDEDEEEPHDEQLSDGDVLLPKSMHEKPEMHDSKGHGIRAMVSQKKRRYQEDGHDLDLTYILPSIIAMGFPTPPGNLEARYRNRLEDVQNMLNSKHAGKYKVYNLCGEREYPADSFNAQKRYPFDDHNPSAVSTIAALCEDAAEFLAQGDDYVVAIHCKAGKGRTGMMVAALMLKLGEFDTGEDSLKYFGYARTKNSKGVSIPSQKRYVDYYSQFLKGVTPERGTAWLHGIKVEPPPHFDMSNGGCNPYMKILQWNVDTLDKETPPTMDSTSSLDLGVGIFKANRHCESFTINLPEGLKLKGDVKIEVYDKDHTHKDEKMFAFWFNVGYTDDEFSLTKKYLDGASKDKKSKHFIEEFRCRVFLGDSPPDGTLGPSGPSQVDGGCCVMM